MICPRCGRVATVPEAIDRLGMCLRCYAAKRHIEDEQKWHDPDRDSKRGHHASKNTD